MKSTIPSLLLIKTKSFSYLRLTVGNYHEMIYLRNHHTSSSESYVYRNAFNQMHAQFWCHRYFLTKLHSLESSFQGGHASDLDGIWKCWFLRRGEKPENQERNLSEQSKEEKQTRSWPSLLNRTWWQVSAITTTPSLLHQWHTLLFCLTESQKKWL